MIKQALKLVVCERREILKVCSFIFHHHASSKLAVFSNLSAFCAFLFMKCNFINIIMNTDLQNPTISLIQKPKVFQSCYIVKATIGSSQRSAKPLFSALIH